MKARISLFLAAVLLTPSLVNAQDLLGSRYSYQNLSKFWDDLGLNTSPASNLYEISETGQLEPTEPSEPCSFAGFEDGCNTGSPFFGAEVDFSRIPAEDEAAPESSETYLLRSAPISSGTLAAIHKRMSRLGMFLARERYFVPTMKDPDETLNQAQKIQQVTQMRNTASAELFLVPLKLYFVEDSIAKKCHRLDSAFGKKNFLSSLGTDSVSFNDASHYLPGTSALISKVSQHMTAFGSLIEDRLVCRMKPASTNYEIREKIRSKVDEAIADLVGDQLKSLNEEISAVQKGLQSLINEMTGVAIPTKEISQLKMDIANTKANLDMARADMFGVGVALNDAEEGKLGLQAKAEQGFPELSNAASASGTAPIELALEGKTTTLRNAITELKTMAQDVLGEGNEACSDLDTKLEGVLSGGSELQFKADFDGCINKIDEVVTSSSAGNADNPFYHKLHQHLESIVEKYN